MAFQQTVNVLRDGPAPTQTVEDKENARNTLKSNALGSSQQSNASSNVLGAWSDSRMNTQSTFGKQGSTGSALKQGGAGGVQLTQNKQGASLKTLTFGASMSRSNSNAPSKGNGVKSTTQSLGISMKSPSSSFEIHTDVSDSSTSIQHREPGSSVEENLNNDEQEELLSKQNNAIQQDGDFNGGYIDDGIDDGIDDEESSDEDEICFKNPVAAVSSSIEIGASSDEEEESWEDAQAPASDLDSDSDSEDEIVLGAKSIAAVAADVNASMSSEGSIFTSESDSDSDEEIQIRNKPRKRVSYRNAREAESDCSPMPSIDTIGSPVDAPSLPTVSAITAITSMPAPPSFSGASEISTGLVDEDAFKPGTAASLGSPFGFNSVDVRRSSAITMGSTHTTAISLLTVDEPSQAVMVFEDELETGPVPTPAQQAAAVDLQAWWRGTTLRQKIAVLRRFVARCEAWAESRKMAHVMEIWEQEDAAETIQRTWRAFAAKKAVQPEISARRIQRWWTVVSARSRLLNTARNLAEARTSAAVTIQAWWKGRQARIAFKNYRTMKRRHAARILTRAARAWLNTRAEVKEVRAEARTHATCRVQEAIAAVSNGVTAPADDEVAAITKRMIEQLVDLSVGPFGTSTHRVDLTQVRPSAGMSHSIPAPQAPTSVSRRQALAARLAELRARNAGSKDYKLSPEPPMPPTINIQALTSGLKPLVLEDGLPLPPPDPAIGQENVAPTNTATTTTTTSTSTTATSFKGSSLSVGYKASAPTIPPGRVSTATINTSSAAPAPAPAPAPGPSEESTPKKAAVPHTSAVALQSLTRKTRRASLSLADPQRPTAGPRRSGRRASTGRRQSCVLGANHEKVRNGSPTPPGPWDEETMNHTEANARPFVYQIVTDRDVHADALAAMNAPPPRRRPGRRVRFVEDPTLTVEPDAPIREDVSADPRREPGNPVLNVRGDEESFPYAEEGYAPVIINKRLYGPPGGF